jgi:hypothetical protein
MILCISNALLTCEMLKRLLLCTPNTDMFVFNPIVCLEPTQFDFFGSDFASSTG